MNIYTVSDFDSDEYRLITGGDSLEVLSYVGCTEEYDFVIVSFDASGTDYEEVYGGYGTPWLTKEVFKLK